MHCYEQGYQNFDMQYDCDMLICGKYIVCLSKYYIIIFKMCLTIYYAI